MIVFTKPVTKRVIACPYCKKSEFAISHLLGGSGKFTQRFGPWYCDSCLRGFMGEIIDEHTVAIEDDSDLLQAQCVDVLEIERALIEPVRVHVSVRHSLDRYAASVAKLDGVVVESGKSYAIESIRYYYEEHTCPSNVLGGHEITCGEDDDPHGVLRYVETRVVRLPWEPITAKGDK